MDELEIEAAKLGREIVSEPAKQFLIKVAGTPGGEIGDILGDRLRLRRWKNAVKMAERAQEFASERGLDPQAIPLSVLFPILEGGANDEDVEMSRRWGALLANASDPHLEVPPAFPAILRELSPMDCRLLDHFAYLLTLDLWPDGREVVSGAILISDLNLEPKVFDVAINNLVRLRLVQPELDTAGGGRHGRPPGTKVVREVGGRIGEHLDCFITPLGEAFLLACGWDWKRSR